MGQHWTELQAEVDTGAYYSWAPRPVLESLGVQPSGQRSFGLADGSVIEREIGVAQIGINGESLPTVVVFGDETGPQFLLGAVTLEEFELAADPVNQRLIRMPSLPRR